MWKLGKFVVMTKGELEERRLYARHIGYQAGLRSKWKAAKKPILSVAGIPVHPDDDVTDLLSAVAPGVVIPSRNAETYATGPTTYGDSLPITEDNTQFNMKESEMEDAA